MPPGVAPGKIPAGVAPGLTSEAAPPYCLWPGVPGAAMEWCGVAIPDGVPGITPIVGVPGAATCGPLKFAQDGVDGDGTAPGADLAAASAAAGVPGMPIGAFCWISDVGVRGMPTGAAGPRPAACRSPTGVLGMPTGAVGPARPVGVLGMPAGRRPVGVPGAPAGRIPPGDPSVPMGLAAPRSPVGVRGMPIGLPAAA